MKLHRLKRTVAILACVFVLGGIAAIGAGAEDAAYAPNRSLTISNVSASTAALRMSVLPRNIGALDAPNGPYHVWARMNIENLEAINTSTDAEVSLAVKYGYFPAGGSDMVYKTVNLRTWTADTDGFVDMVTEDGPHFAIDAIDASQEDDVYCEFILEFTMTNAKGDFTVADLVIADKDDEIVYSLANDPCFSGITDFSRKQSSEPGFMWAPVISGGDASIRVDTAGENTYVPNRVLTLNIPENVEGETSYPENCAYLHLNVKDPGTTAFTEEGSPYTLRGMVKVENFAKNTSQRDGDAIEQAKNPAFLMGNPLGTYHGLTADTNGWVPFLKGDGTPFTFKYADISNWLAQFWGSWGCTGQYSLADFEVLDKDGNVVYSFETDTDLVDGATYDAPHITPTTTGGKAGLYLWAAHFDTKYSFSYNVADTLTTHTADDYKIRTFDETYTPYVAPVTSDASVPSTPGTGSTPSAGGSSDGSVASTPSTPSTGAGFPMIVLGVGAAAAAAALVTFRKKHR